MGVINMERHPTTSMSIRTWVETCSYGLSSGSQVDQQLTPQVFDDINRSGYHGAVLCTGWAEATIVPVASATSGSSVSER